MTAIFLLSPSRVFAGDDFPAQGRLFVAYPKFAPSDLNADLTSAGLGSFTNILHGGVEITTPVIPILNVGFRYSPRLAYVTEKPTDPNTDYYGGVVQQAMMGVVRVTPVKLPFLRADAFVGIGAAKTSFTIKTASQNGSLAHASVADWFAYPMYSYGASVGTGYGKFFIYLEGVYEKNKAARLVPSGTISSGVRSIDMSGYYFAIGLMFDGVTAHSSN